MPAKTALFKQNKQDVSSILGSVAPLPTKMSFFVEFMTCKKIASYTHARKEEGEKPIRVTCAT